MTNRVGRKVAVVGVGYSPIARKSNLPIGAITLTACLNALDDAGLTGKEVDALAEYSFGTDAPPAWFVASCLGVPNLDWYVEVQGSGPSGIAGAMAGATAVAAGRSEVCLIYRAITQQAGSAVRREPAPGPPLAGGGPPGAAGWANQFLMPYGHFGAIVHEALQMRRYMEEYGAKEEHFGALAVAERAFASLNERAVMRTPLTMGDYLNSRYVSEPMHLLDCDLPVDGACAVVLASEERARDLRNRPVWIDSWAFGTNYDWFVAQNHTASSAFPAARAMWAKSDLRALDVDVAELYDGFTMRTFIWLEALGLCGLGEAGPFVAEGNTGLGGRLPVNTHGGQLSEGRLHGLAHLAEAVLQLRGACGPRQTPDARVAAVANAGGAQAGCMVLVRE
jgi:acetyl-CoA acetyltransferase